MLTKDGYLPDDLKPLVIAALQKPEMQALLAAAELRKAPFGSESSVESYAIMAARREGYEQALFYIRTLAYEQAPDMTKASHDAALHNPVD